MMIDSIARELALGRRVGDYQTSDVQDVQSILNTQLKKLGLEIWDKDRKRPLWAKGALPEDPWVDGVGASIDTPFRTYPGWDMALDFKNGGYRSGNVATRDVTQLPGYTYTRSGQKYEDNGSGVLLPFAANVPAIIPGIGFWARPSYQNLCPNSEFASAGTVPTGLEGYNTFTQNGVTRSVAGRGVDANGMAYIDLLVQGAAAGGNASFAPSFSGSGTVGPAAAPGEVFSSAVTTAIIAGTIAPAGINVSYSLDFVNDANAGTGGARSAALPDGPAAIRTPLIAVTVPSNTVRVRSRLSIIVTDGTTCDFTIRIWAPSLVKSPIVGPYIPTSNGAVTVPGEEMKASFAVLQDEDFAFIVRSNSAPAGINAQERFAQIDDGSANNRVWLQRNSSGVTFGTAVTNGSFGSAVNAASSAAQLEGGRISMALRRRSGKITVANVNKNGVFGVSSEVSQPFPSGIMRASIPPASTLTPNAPIEFFGLRRGTFSDAEIETMLRTAGI